MPGKKAAPDMNPKQVLFVAEYLKDLDPQAAYVRAGYDASTAHVGAYKMLKRPHVAAAIQAAMDKRADRIGLKAETVLDELRRLTFVDIGKLVDKDGRVLPLDQMPEDERRAIAGIEVEELFEGRGDERVLKGLVRKIKLVDKAAMIRLALQHLGLLKLKLEIEGHLTLEELVPKRKA